MKEKIFSVTIADCEVQTFSAGGAGGQKRDHGNSGVRIIHHPSGARGESREERSQLQNKKTAFRRMAETQKFRIWLAKMTGTMKTESQLEAEVEKSLAKPGAIKVESKVDGKWVEDESLS